MVRKFRFWTSQNFRRHNFGNSSSLLKVEVNKWLIESLVVKWDVTNQVFWFSSIDLCTTIEEYFRILGIPYNTRFIVSRPFNQSFNLRISEAFGIKNNISEKGDETNECFQNMLNNLFANRSAYERSQSVSFSSTSSPNHSIWARYLRSCPISDKHWRSRYQVTNIPRVDEKSHTFIPVFLEDTFRAMNIAKTSRSLSLTYCISLL